MVICSNLMKYQMKGVHEHTHTHTHTHTQKGRKIRIVAHIQFKELALYLGRKAFVTVVLFNQPIRRYIYSWIITVAN